MSIDDSKIVLSAGQVSDIKQMVKALESQKAHVSEEVVGVLKGLIDVIESDRWHIVRSMMLPEVYLQAGMALLHYFARIVGFIHPDVTLNLSVSQEGNYVKLVIETAETDRSVIEELLENYGLALKGKVPLNGVVTDPNHLMEWKQILDLSALEVKVTRDVMEAPSAIRDEDIEALGADARTLHHLVGEGVSGLHALTAIIDSVIEDNRKSINEALLTLQKKLSGKITAADEEEVKEALSVILRYEPEIFKEIHSVIEGGSVSGRTADSLLSWIASLSGVMPR